MTIPTDEPYDMRLQVLRPSRKRRKPGDIFVMLPPDGRYLYGRVIRTDLKEIWGVENLVYVYTARSMTELPIPQLLPSDLLCGPMLVGNYLWRDGYAKTIESRSLSSQDILSSHSFYDELRDCYWDVESKNKIPRGPGPIATTDLWLLPGLEKRVLHALGIESFPDVIPKHRPL